MHESCAASRPTIALPAGVAHPWETFSLQPKHQPQSMHPGPEPCQDPLPRASVAAISRMISQGMWVLSPATSTPRPGSLGTQVNGTCKPEDCGGANGLCIHGKLLQEGFASTGKTTSAGFLSHPWVLASHLQHPWRHFVSPVFQGLPLWEPIQRQSLDHHERRTISVPKGP